MMMFGGSFKSMIEQKEREIVKLCEEQIVTLQKQIVDKDNELAKRIAKILDKDNELARLIAKVLLLQEDFKYNLNLIDERDAELKQYDQEMSSLKVSVTEGERRLNEISHSLLETESKVLEEKVGKDEMTKKYKKKINDLQEQMEELRLEKDVEYQNKLESLEAINADLLQQLIEKQKEYDCKSKEMVKRYGDKKQSQTLQFELELDEVKQKLRVGDTQLKHLERELEAAVTREKLQDELEEELRLRIRDKEKEIQKISLAFQQLQNEMESLKVKAECEASCMSEKLKCIEGDYQIQNVQLKDQIESLMLKLEVAEAHLGSCEKLKLEQLSACAEKLRHIEKEMLHKENYFKKKLEESEIQARDAAQVQEQHEQELKSQLIRWKAEHDIIRSKYTSLQKELLITLERERRSQEDQKLATSKKVYEEMLSRHVMPPSLVDECDIGSPRKDFLDSKVSTSPIISPTSKKGIPWSLQSNDALIDHFEQTRTTEVELENRRLHAIVRDLKDENKRVRSIIGTMRTEMESLQKNAFEEGFQNSANIVPDGNKANEVKQLQEEMKFLKSRITSMATNLQSIQESKMESRLNPRVEEQFVYAQPSRSIMLNQHQNDLDSAGNRPHSGSKLKVADVAKSEVSLQAQLEAAVDNITRITHERDLLMELSNSLRADLNRVLIPSFDATLANDLSVMALQDDNTTYQYDTNCSNCGHMNSCSCLGTSPAPQARIPGRHMTSAYHSLEATSNIQGGSEFHANVGHVSSKESFQLEGNTYVHHCQQAHLKDIIHKGTASQRARYKASLRHRDQQKHGKLKIRNYNVKDDFVKELEVWKIAHTIITQAKHILAILQRFKIKNCKPIATPLEENHKLSSYLKLAIEPYKIVRCF